MPRYTLFSPSGTPVRANVPSQPLAIAIGDWRFRISAEPKSSAHSRPAHELTHTVQQSGAPVQAQVFKSIKGSGGQRAAVDVRGWDFQTKKAITGANGSAWAPEVDDEVLIAFQHGDAAAHAALFLHPGPVSRGSAQVQVDVSPGMYRLQVVQRGSSPLSIAVATAADPAFTRNVGWQVLC